MRTDTARLCARPDTPPPAKRLRAVAELRHRLGGRQCTGDLHGRTDRDQRWGLRRRCHQPVPRGRARSTGRGRTWKATGWLRCGSPSTPGSQTTERSRRLPSRSTYSRYNRAAAAGRCGGPRPDCPRAGPGLTRLLRRSEPPRCERCCRQRRRRGGTGHSAVPTQQVRDLLAAAKLESFFPLRQALAAALAAATPTGTDPTAHSVGSENQAQQRAMSRAGSGGERR